MRFRRLSSGCPFSAHRSGTDGDLGHIAKTWLMALPGSRKAVFFVAKLDRSDLDVLRELSSEGT